MIKHTVKYIIDTIFWGVYGKTIGNPKIPLEVKSILFVCKGNICRSPFAEKYANQNPNISDQYQFSSAGIIVGSPQAPPVEGVIAAYNYGVNLQDHKSRSINYRMMESFDLIVAMEVCQYKYLNKLFAEFKDKIFLLPLFDNNIELLNQYSIYNIKDPYGKSQDEFIKCFDRIKHCIEGLFKDIHSNEENII